MKFRWGGLSPPGVDLKKKIKQFIWRLAHNSLSLKINIKRQEIDLKNRCPVCLRFDEDGGHCFLECKAVKRCWQDLALELIVSLIS